MEASGNLNIDRTVMLSIFNDLETRDSKKIIKNMEENERRALNKILKALGENKTEVKVNDFDFHNLKARIQLGVQKHASSEKVDKIQKGIANLFADRISSKSLSRQLAVARQEISKQFPFHLFSNLEKLYVDLEKNWNTPQNLELIQREIDFLQEQNQTFTRLEIVGKDLDVKEKLAWIKLEQEKLSHLKNSIEEYQKQMKENPTKESQTPYGIESLIANSLADIGERIEDYQKGIQKLSREQIVSFLSSVNPDGLKSLSKREKAIVQTILEGFQNDEKFVAVDREQFFVLRSKMQSRETKKSFSIRETVSQFIKGSNKDLEEKLVDFEKKLAQSQENTVRQFLLEFSDRHDNLLSSLRDTTDNKDKQIFLLKTTIKQMEEKINFLQRSSHLDFLKKQKIDLLQSEIKSLKRQMERLQGNAPVLENWIEELETSLAIKKYGLERKQEKSFEEVFKKILREKSFDEFRQVVPESFKKESFYDSLQQTYSKIKEANDIKRLPVDANNHREQIELIDKTVSMINEKEKHLKEPCMNEQIKLICEERQILENQRRLLQQTYLVTQKQHKEWIQENEQRIQKITSSWKKS